MIDQISGVSKTSFPTSLNEPYLLRTSSETRLDTLQSQPTDCLRAIWNFIIQFFSWLFGCDDLHEKNDSLENKIIREIPSLREAVKELRRKIDKLDGFISQNPELRKIVSETLPGYVAQGFAATYIPPSTDHLDPNIPNHELALLKYEQIMLSHELSERMVFIQSDSAVYECFVKYVKENN